MTDEETQSVKDAVDDALKEAEADIAAFDRAMDELISNAPRKSGRRSLKFEPSPAEKQRTARALEIANLVSEVCWGSGHWWEGCSDEEFSYLKLSLRHHIK